jgi:Uma2 family endonuclease
MWNGHSMSETVRLVTAEEFEKLPGDDHRYELVEGRVVRMSPVGYLHGRIVVNLATLLNQHVKARRLGVVLTEVGFMLASKPDTVRAPDIAFIAGQRLPPDPRGFWQGAPDLAIEVLSRDDRPSEISLKVTEYLTHGVALVAVIDPDARAIAVHRPPAVHAVVRGGDLLDFDPVVPGFRCALTDVFD